MFLIDSYDDFSAYVQSADKDSDHPIIHRSPINNQYLFWIRVISLIYLSAIFIWEIEMSSSTLINIIYLTQWGYFTTWLYFFLVIQHYILYECSIIQFGTKVYKYEEKLKYWIELIYEFSFCAQLPITLVFWGILFKIVLGMDDVTAEIIALNANLHAGPIICLLIQLPFNSFRFPSPHFVVVFIAGMIYMLINMLYSVLVTPVYRPINWVSVVSYLLCISAILLAYLMHFLGRLVYNRYKQEKLSSQSYLKLVQGKTIQFITPQQHIHQLQNRHQKNSDDHNSDIQIRSIS